MCITVNFGHGHMGTSVVDPCFPTHLLYVQIPSKKMYVQLKAEK